MKYKKKLRQVKQQPELYQDIVITLSNGKTITTIVPAFMTIGETIPPHVVDVKVCLPAPVPKGFAFLDFDKKGA
ncbi:MAG: hypothetical protein VB050_18265 [Geobacteraceae bacterium]|nr:hypothetical protein [Geobacteraceae bacterium]